jgi:protocatechuate 3,4-dioxygenase beta subunit
MKRRNFLGFLGVAALSPLGVTPALADERPPTPRLTEGPFYPRSFPSDSDADLTRVVGRAKSAEGTVLEVSGRVIDRSGKPRANSRVEIWQCDAFGQYHHVGEPEGAGDADFQGWGAVTTDGDGRYSFRTIRPVPYPGRTPHIHFTVAENGRRRLTSQIFIEGEAQNARDGIYRSLGRDAKLVTMSLENAGATLKGSFDIVL